MARIRSIHPEICTDETLVGISATAERTFVRLLPHLDDAGRAVYNPKLLKAALYPLHDHITAEHVAEDIGELHGAGLVVLYSKDGKNYISAKADAWSRWQKPRWKYESKLPAPDDAGVTEMQYPSDVRRTTSDDRRTVVELESSRSRSGDGAAAVTSDVRPTNVHAHPTLERRQRLFEEAVGILAGRHMNRVQSHANPKRHRQAVVAGKLQDHADEAFLLIDGKPEITAVELADKLEPNSGKPVASNEPGSSVLPFHVSSCACGGLGTDRTCRRNEESA